MRDPFGAFCAPLEADRFERRRFADLTTQNTGRPTY
jgi:hypothetical protein